MNIAIDVTPLENGHGHRGTGVYVKNLIGALQKYENKHSYTLITRGQKLPDHVDLVHYPYFDPFFLTLPLIKKIPVVTTVHDLIPLVFPDKFPAGIKGGIKWQIQKLSLMGSGRIITDSESSKRDIARITGYDSQKIDTVYLAPDPGFTRTRPAYASEPYLLYVGDVNWNKNVAGLLRAFASLKKYQLLIVGRAFTDDSLKETREINLLIRELGIEKSVHKSGYVPNGVLAGMYRGALGLVLPSFYEGFGLPVLEAMRCGCPVIAADTSSVREISGPCIKVNTDPDSIAAGMRVAVSLSPAKRTELIRAQSEWVRRFTWQNVARETVGVYEKTVNNNTRL